MSEFLPYTPHSSAFVREELKRLGLWLSRERGQNYLVDKSIAERIVATVPEGAVVCEVGTGLGALTSLVHGKHRLYGIEIDSGVYAALSARILGGETRLIHADFLKWDPSETGEKELFFLSNLPYSISGEALRRFIELPIFQEGTVMVQKEFFERMTAKPGGGEYGAFAVACQLYLSAEKVCDVGRGAFFPAPTVDSAVVRLKKVPCKAPQSEVMAFLRKGFLARRKTLLNNLKDLGFTREILTENGFDPALRPEELTSAEWLSLFLKRPAV